MWIDAVREGSRARRSWERGGFKALRGADGGGRGLRGGGGTRRNKRGRQQQAKHCRGLRGRQQSAACEVRKSAGGTLVHAKLNKRIL